MHKLRFVSVFAIAGATMVACASPDEGGSADDDVVTVSHSSVKDQEIGNCWIYAGIGWAESLHLNYAGVEQNYSESWQTYNDWFHGILDGDVTDAGIQTGGWFGESQDWISRYGVMDEAYFIPGEQNTEGSARQASALAKINTSLKSGVLSDPAKRRDKNVVRDELDKAWQLSDEVKEAIDATFGHTFERDFLRGATVPASVVGLHAPSSITVGWSTEKNREVTLADATGTAASTWDVKTRRGEFAWSEERYPTGASQRRQFQIKAQTWLHKRYPLAIVWYVDFNAFKNGEFRAPPEKPGRQGGHISLLTDYEIDDVPGYGTLPAGQDVSDPVILDAALSPQASIKYLRIKNSWGTGYPDLEPELEKSFKGYHNLYMAYLNASLPTCDTKDANGNCQGYPRNAFTGMVFPSKAWDKVGPKPAPPPAPEETCAHDMCNAGVKLDATCNVCVELICEADPYCCNNAWDGICVKDAKFACDLSCE